MKKKKEKKMGDGGSGRGGESLLFKPKAKLLGVFFFCVLWFRFCGSWWFDVQGGEEDLGDDGGVGDNVKGKMRKWKWKGIRYFFCLHYKAVFLNLRFGLVIFLFWFFFSLGLPFLSAYFFPFLQISVIYGTHKKDPLFSPLL